MYLNWAASAAQFCFCPLLYRLRRAFNRGFLDKPSFRCVGLRVDFSLKSFDNTLKDSCSVGV